MISKQMKKATLITLLAVAIGQGVFGQSKPKKVTIKKSVTISKDSTYYLPDTIACVFQELVVKPDTVYTKWHNGFVVWQVWNTAYLWSNISGTSVWTGGYTLAGSQEEKPVKSDYRFSDTMPGIFLYPDKTKVTNKVTNAYSK